MAYIGSSAALVPVSFSTPDSQAFNGNDSSTVFTLSRPIVTTTQLEIIVNNVQQSPYDGSYSVSGTTLTFSEAPSTGTANVYVNYRDQAIGTITDETSVAKTGDTMSGTLIINGELFVNNNEVNLDDLQSLTWGDGSVQVRGDGTAETLELRTSAATRVFVDSSGLVGIGTTSPSYKLEVKGAAATAGQLSIHDGTGDTVTSGNNAGSLLFQARDSSIRTIAEIDAIHTTTNGTGAAMVFQTRVSDALAERMRIDNAGHVIVPNGITLGTAAGTYTAENTLDDYEEGSFTGTLTGGTTAPSTPITAVGYYTKVGRLVEISIAFANKDNTGASGTVTVTGLPFTSASTVLHLGSVVNTRGPNEQSSSYVSTGASSLIQVNYAGGQTAWASTGAGVYAYFSIVYPAA